MRGRRRRGACGAPPQRGGGKTGSTQSVKHIGNPNDFSEGALPCFLHKSAERGALGFSTILS